MKNKPRTRVSSTVSHHILICTNCSAPVCPIWVIKLSSLLWRIFNTRGNGHAVVVREIITRTQLDDQDNHQWDAVEAEIDFDATFEHVRWSEWIERWLTAHSFANRWRTDWGSPSSDPVFYRFCRCHTQSLAISLIKIICNVTWTYILDISFNSARFISISFWISSYVPCMVINDRQIYLLLSAKDSAHVLPYLNQHVKHM